jgi:hypothetical protein
MHQRNITGHREEQKCHASSYMAKEIRREHCNINHLSPHKEGNRSRRLTNASKTILKNNKVPIRHEENNSTINKVLDTLKQKLKVLSKRVRRYLDSNKR